MKNLGKEKDHDEIRVIQEKIHPLVFNEFYKYLEELENGTPEEVADDDKLQFAVLASQGNVESYRKIEHSIKNGNLSKELRDFAIVALNFCRFKLENELDMECDMISGGLGGVDNKIRYFLALTSGEEITNEKLKYIEKCFDSISRSKDSLIEEVKNHGFYISLIILGSFNYAIGDIIDSGLRECDFLNSDFYLSNVEIPTDDRIRDWLDEKLDDEDPYSFLTRPGLGTIS